MAGHCRSIGTVLEQEPMQQLKRQRRIMPVHGRKVSHPSVPHPKNDQAMGCNMRRGFLPPKTTYRRHPNPPACIQQSQSLQRKTVR